MYVMLKQIKHTCAWKSIQLIFSLIFAKKNPSSYICSVAPYLFKVDFCIGNIIVVEEAYPKVIKEQHMLKISSRLFITCFGNTQPIAKKSV